MANYLTDYLFNTERTSVNMDNIRALGFRLDDVEDEREEIFVRHAIKFIETSNLSTERTLVQNFIKDFNLELLQLHVPTMEAGWNGFIEKPEIFNIMVVFLLGELQIESVRFNGDLFVESDLTTYAIMSHESLSMENAEKIIETMMKYDLDKIFGAEGSIFLRNFFSLLATQVSEEFILKYEGLFIIPIVNIVAREYPRLRYIEGRENLINPEFIDIQDVSETIDLVEEFIEELENTEVLDEEHRNLIKDSISKSTADISYLYNLLSVVAKLRA